MSKVGVVATSVDYARWLREQPDLAALDHVHFRPGGPTLGYRLDVILVIGEPLQGATWAETDRLREWWVNEMKLKLGPRGAIFYERTI